MVETASQTLLTMEKFSTNHNNSSSSFKTRERRKSPSPRLRKTSLDLGKSVSKTARTDKDGGGAGETLKEMFIKKFIPWKRNVGSTEEEIVPGKGDVLPAKQCGKCKHQRWWKLSGLDPAQFHLRKFKFIIIFYLIAQSRVLFNFWNNYAKQTWNQHSFLLSPVGILTLRSQIDKEKELKDLYFATVIIEHWLFNIHS